MMSIEKIKQVLKVTLLSWYLNLHLNVKNVRNRQLCIQLGSLSLF